MSRTDLFLLLGVALAVLGIARMLLTRDLIGRVIGLNVASGGVLMLLLTVALRSGSAVPDALPHAMVLTGIVITVSVTALAVVLIRRIESEPEESEP